MDEIVERMDGMCVSSKYELDQEAQVLNAYHVTGIKLNFYQLWYMFRALPHVYDGGKSAHLSGVKLYEYKLRTQTGDFFTIYAWSMKGGLLKETQWHVGATSREPVVIQDFLEYLYDVLRCYAKHFKCIERKVFESEYAEVDREMKEIKTGLIRYRDVLNIL
jgi:hypothetical protein